MYLLAQTTGIVLEEMGAIASTFNNFPVMYDRMKESSSCSNLFHLFILILDTGIYYGMVTVF